MDPRPDSPPRVRSVDLLRGIVMMLMALDHVRVYSGVPAGSPEPLVFLTRWVTHFCAPAFFFLAGTSGFLSMRRRGRAGIARSFLVRGLWLVLLELTLVRVSWGFDLDLSGYLLAGVLWSLGWSMVAMAGLVLLPPLALGGLGLAIVGLHDLVGGLYMTGSPWRESHPWFARVLHTGGIVRLGGETPLLVLYSLVPWIGVMAAGFVFGRALEQPVERRDRTCLYLGGGLVALFLLLRATGWYGDPRPRTSFGDGWPAWIAFLNTTKYPASLCYLLMTLGPILLALPALERARGPLCRVVETFGRLPLFFYVLHIPLIHALALVVAVLRTPEAVPWLFDSHPLPVERAPEGYAYSLPLLYGLTALALLLLYGACLGYARLRPRLPAAIRGLL